MDLKQSSKYEEKFPGKEESIKIPVNKWEALKVEVDRIDPTGPFLPGFIGGLLGFWLSTLVFSHPSLVPGRDTMFWAFTLLWAGSVGAYLLIFAKQSKQIGDIKNKIEEIINDVGK